MNILSTHGLSKYFGGIHAVDKLDITIEKGHIHGLIGPNGSGKSTLFYVITGLLPVTEGTIYFNSVDITNLSPQLITKLGIGRSFQRAIIMPMMNCLENVMLGMHSRGKEDILGTWLRLPFTSSRQESTMKQRAMELLEFVGLERSARRFGSELVWAETQLLQIARAVATEPKILLLDEPTSGMGPEETKRVERIIRQIRDDMGITVFMVSHDVSIIMNISDRITVLNFGKKIYEGTPAQVQNHPAVCEAYFGKQ